MIYTYKVSFKNSMWHLRTVIYYAIILLIGVPIFSYHRYGYVDPKFFYTLFPVALMILIIPQIILHLNYYFTNKNDNLICDYNNGTISIQNGEKINNFRFSDIEKVEIYKSFPLAENRNPWFPWDHYSYLKLHLYNKNIYYISSLLEKNLVLPIQDSKIILKKRFYPYIGRF